MALSFSKQVKNWQNATELRIELAFQESIQDLAREANTPRDKGGNVPVDTGFLINSLAAELNSIPVGPSEPPENYMNQQWDATPVLLVVNNAKIGDSVTLGYTANYAQKMELKYAFLRLAAQNWPQIVANVVKKIDKRVKSRK